MADARIIGTADEHFGSLQRCVAAVASERRYIAMLEGHRLFSSRRSPENGLLPRARGTGMGRRLAEAVVESARERGMERIQLDVFAPNTRAIRLY